MDFLKVFKKRNKIIIATLVAISLLTVIATAATYPPGSTEDPVVTKSYVDSKLAELESKLGGTTGSANAYTPLQITQGKTLLGGEGTEIIFRSGEATAIDNGQNGISDITGAKDLRTGESLTLNHLIVIPKEDGRGINASTDIWVLIKGKYTIR
ncbi:MAG: hypothetical protein WCF96_02035 [Eubacteriales bacterium]